MWTKSLGLGCEDEGLDQLVGLECGCDYPHGHDFEPAFEICNCTPGCSHDARYPTQEDADIGEEMLELYQGVWFDA